MKTTRIAIFPVLALILMPIYFPRADDPEKSAESYYQHAQTAFKQDDLDEAADLMEKALKLDPENCEYHWERGNLQGARAQKASIFTKISKAKSCKKHWEKAVELCPDSVKYLEGLMFFCLQAPGIAGGDKDNAERLLQEIYACDSTRGYLAQADFAIIEEDYGKARDIYDRLLVAGRDTLDVLRKLGNMYNYFIEDYGRALPYYLRVLAAEPDDWECVYQAARTAILSEQSSRETIELMRRYLTHPAETNLPGHSAAYWRLGMAYEQMGSLDSAYTCYEASLELEPDYKQAKKALKNLEKKLNK